MTSETKANIRLDAPLLALDGDALPHRSMVYMGDLRRHGLHMCITDGLVMSSSTGSENVSQITASSWT